MINPFRAPRIRGDSGSPVRWTTATTITARLCVAARRQADGGDALSPYSVIVAAIVPKPIECGAGKVWSDRAGFLYGPARNAQPDPSGSIRLDVWRPPRRGDRVA